jgi:D-alanyl-D-alanine carboxypeptidase-like protein
MRRTALLLLLVAALAATGCGATGGAAVDARAAAERTMATVGAPGPADRGPAAELAPTTTAAGAGTAVKATGAAGPRFKGSIWPIGKRARQRMRWSWRPGCPVGLARLRLLRVDYWGFDRRVHTGMLVVHRDHARRILMVMEKLFTLRYKIQRLRLVDDYRADDDRSMAANNTSGFNCRFVSGTRRWSEHAYGRAIDLNPLRNPYVTRGGRVSPPAGRPYANRARRATGMIYAGDAVVRAFAAAGWRWGGYWSGSKDYQHFSATGR